MNGVVAWAYIQGQMAFALGPSCILMIVVSTIIFAQSVSSIIVYVNLSEYNVMVSFDRLNTALIKMVFKLIFWRQG